MRDCPTIDGSSIPLIIHRIAAGDCLARQSCNYHKCHRCIYRGQAANWEPAEAPMAMLNVHAAEEPVHAEVKQVEIARPDATKKQKRGKAAPKTIDVSV